MKYLLHQGSFDFPWAVEDHSSNLLVLTQPDNGETLSITINRDRLEPGENLEDCVKRQVKLAARQIPGYEELSRKPLELGIPGLECIQTETRCKQEGHTMAQFQVIMRLPASRELLMAALTIPGSATEEHRKLWQRIIASYALPAQ